MLTNNLTFLILLHILSSISSLVLHSTLYMTGHLRIFFTRVETSIQERDQTLGDSGSQNLPIQWRRVASFRKYVAVLVEFAEYMKATTTSGLLSPRGNAISRDLGHQQVRKRELIGGVG
jgi:hypothetical protein